MKNTNNDNTPGAKTNIQTPLNQSLRQSLYIAALDRHLGLRGLIFPVEDKENNISYDFMHAETGQLIKVFKKLHQDEFVKYELSRPDDSPLFIVDELALERSACECCDEDIVCLKSEELMDARTVFDVMLYLDDQLWQFCDATQTWEPIMPVERERCIEALVAER